MPYIANEERCWLDPEIEELAAAIVDKSLSNAHVDPDTHTPIEGDVAGILNYAITSLVMEVMWRRFGKMKYRNIALMSGVLKNVSDEFYRRVAAPYEDYCIAKNGDIELYKHYEEESDAAKKNTRKPKGTE